MALTRDRPHPGRSGNGVLLLIVMASVALRIALQVPAWSRPPSDPDNYLPLARALLGGHGLSFEGRPTAYRPPLYPVVLVPVVASSAITRSLWPGVTLLHLLAGAATVVCTGLAARRLGLGHSPSLLAASLTALDPVLAAQSRSIMTETLAAFLLSATLVTFSGRAPWSPLLGGLWLGASVLCRPSLLPSALMTAAAALAFGPGSGKVRMLRSGSILLGVVLPLLPWAVRNASILGTPVWTTTHGGFTLYLANNPVYYEDVVSSRGAAVWSGERQRAWFVQINEEASGLAEPVADRLFTMRALETIRAHPWVFLHASLKRLARFWGIAPSEAVYSTPQRLLAALWTIPFWILVCGGAMRRSLWKWPACACPAIVAGLTCVHLFYWTDLRMRAPLVPALALIAAGSWTALSEWQSRREAVIG